MTTRNVTAALKRDPQFENFRNYFFDEIGQNRTTLFNFFFENNDIFHTINPEDEAFLQYQYLRYANRTFNYTFGTLAGVLFVDKVVMRYGFPNFKIKHFRPLIWVGKYIGAPLLGYGICKYYCCRDIEKTFKDAVDKYNFGYEDYTKAMDVLENVFKVGKPR